MKGMWKFSSPAERAVTVLLVATYVACPFLAMFAEHRGWERSLAYSVLAMGVFFLLPALSLWLGRSASAGEMTGRIPLAVDKPRGAGASDARGLGLSSAVADPIPRGETAASHAGHLGWLTGFYAVLFMDEVWADWPLAWRAVLLGWSLAVAAYLVWLGRRSVAGRLQQS
jgi:hypothetical protein